LESFNLSTDAPSKKLASKHLGPYNVVGHIGQNAYRIDTPRNWRVHNVFHTSLLSRTKTDSIANRIPPPEPIVTVLEQELWVIDKFVNSHWFRGKFQLKVHWEDQEEDQDDWQDYNTILREAAEWRNELVVRNTQDNDPVIEMCDEYY